MYEKKVLEGWILGWTIMQGRSMIFLRWGYPAAVLRCQMLVICAADYVLNKLALEKIERKGVKTRK